MEDLHTCHTYILALPHSEQVHKRARRCGRFLQFDTVLCLVLKLTRNKSGMIDHVFSKIALSIDSAGTFHLKEYG